MPGRHPIEEAREAKEARALFLKKLGRGDLKPSLVLRKPPVALKNTDIYEILLASHGLGREGVRTVLERAVVWPHTHLGDLTANERARLRAALPERAK